MNVRRWLLAGLLTGIVDGLFSSVLAEFFYGSSVQRLFKGVASVPFGASATWPAGILLHFCVAFFWAGVFAIVYARSQAIRRANLLATAAVYGPLVWMAMSLVVIPLLAHRPPSITVRWWIQFFGHMVFVGLPIVAVVRGGER